MALSGCQRGCARDWLVAHGVGEAPGRPAPFPLNAVDCSDGLARCNEGVVEASRLAAIPQPCKRPPPQCECPWDRLGDCENGCSAEGSEVVIDRSLALAQLCAPGADASAVMRMTGAVPRAATCDEGQLYRCNGADVIACREHIVIGQCVRGCFAPQASLEGSEPVNREAAFAVLCSR